MPQNAPPTIDPIAAQRWLEVPADASPWLHEEVARRMAERLQWIRLQPATWLDWAPMRGGLLGHWSVWTKRAVELLELRRQQTEARE